MGRSVHMFWCVSRHTSYAGDSCYVEPKFGMAEMRYLPTCEHLGIILADSVHSSEAELGREDCPNRGHSRLDRSNYYLLPAAENRIYPTLGGPSAINLPDRFYHELIELLCAWCVIGSGEHGAC